MKKKLFVFSITLVFVLCCVMATNSWAAKQTDIYKSNAKDVIKKLNENNGIGNAFGLTDDSDFVLIKQRTDFNGETHFHYQQTFKGIPVWGMKTIISKGKSNKVEKLHGAVVHEASNDIGSIPKKLDALSALKEMQENHKAQDVGSVWNFSNEKYGTFVYFNKKSNKARVCYVVSYFADTECSNPSQPIFFIDAKNGKIIDSYDMLRYADGVGPGGNQKVGYYYYGTDYDPFCVSVNGSTCTMNCTDIKTVDLNHGTSGTTAYSYTCYENTHESINGAYCPLNDAQYFGQVVFDVYMDWYGEPVLPFQLTLRCHYSNNYENAFWDGSTMTFGDGYTTFYPLVSLDVVAHEVSHGFTEYNSDLTYSGQSGGINESFSDMAGEAAKYYMRGTNDFMCGYDIFKDPSGALRYLYDPPLDGQSIDHVDDYYSGMDVHYSSGVFNKAFYLIASSSGWTTRMAFDIFVKANTDYWTASTNFQQGGEGALDATLDYGYNCTDVVNAFAQVGITLSCPAAPVADFVGSPVSGEATLTVNFTDQSTNSPTSWSWNFGDGGTSTAQNPSHDYTSVGTYTVTLTAANSSGSDQEVKTNYITVTTPQPPVISNVNAVDINDTTARIVWDTDELSDSVVYYGLTTSYGSSASNSSMVTSHSVTLTGLTPNTLYHYKVESTDATSNTSQSGDFTFTTLEEPVNPDIYVYNISMQKFWFLWLYRAEGTITIKDTDGAVVPNATVYIQWSGKASGTNSGVTNSSGQVTFNSGWYWGDGTFTITVTNVTHATLQYNSALNIETSDSI